MKILLDKNKKFYKANLHSHSVYSDGHLTVEEMKEAYMKKGYSIIAFTDHEHLIDNSHLDDENFLSITSCEVAVKEFPEQSTLVNMDMRVGHFNFYALDQHNTVTPCYSSVYDHFVNDLNRDKIKFEGEYERKYSIERINEMIRIANEKGFIVSYNHPNWSLENATRYLGYENLFAVEIVNGGCIKAGYVDNEGVFDDILRSGKKIFATTADDNHNPHPIDSKLCDSFGGWVMINAEKLEYSEIMSALQRGDFYASTGPEITSLTRDGDTVRVECSDAKKIVLVTGGRRIAKEIADIGENLNSAEFTVKETDHYFRIRVEDEYGKKAYTQGYEV